MKTLYFDCGMGAAGDMLSAALLELFDDKQAVLNELNALGIPGVEFKAEVSTKCGINGTHLSVTVNGEEEESADVHDHEHHAHDHVHAHEHHHDHEHVGEALEYGITTTTITNIRMSMNTTTGITTTAAWRISSISSGICRWRMRCVQT